MVLAYLPKVWIWFLKSLRRLMLRPHGVMVAPAWVWRSPNNWLSSWRGSIGLESQLGVGSRFWFKLPASQEQAELDRKVRVLLVQSNPLDRELTQSILLRYGTEVEVAEDLPEANEMIQSRSYQIVMFDCPVSDAEAFNLVHSLRKAVGSTAGILLVAMIEIAECSQDELRRAGVDEFVYKPLSVDQIRQLVSNVLA